MSESFLGVTNIFFKAGVVRPASLHQESQAKPPAFDSLSQDEQIEFIALTNRFNEEGRLPSDLQGRLYLLNDWAYRNKAV